MTKRITGVIVSDRMDKTRVIEVTRNVLHPLYKKRYKVSKRFYAHDEENRTKIGDQVVIEEIRPLSRLKRWTIIAVTKPSSGNTGIAKGSSTDADAAPPKSMKNRKKIPKRSSPRGHK